MANDFVADPMNRVKPGDIVSVRVISIDEKRGRIGFSMKPEIEKPVRSAAKPTAENAGNDDKGSRPRSNHTNSNRSDNHRPAADKRPSKTRGNRQDKDSNKNRSKAPRADKAESPVKVGTFGALLQEAGVTKTKK